MGHDQALASLRPQFEKERELASLIRAASPHARPRAYADAYAELYKQFPNIATDEAEEGNRVRTTLSFLEPFRGERKLAVEVGAGRCDLAVGLAAAFEKVIAFDVAELGSLSGAPSNFEHRVFDGVSIDLPSSSADLVISDNVIEHLHPDDALPQICELVRVLKPGGFIAVLTPNKASGPHDISAGFTAKPEGLHLKEYGSLDVKRVLREAGCSSVRSYLGFGGRYVPTPPELTALIETVGDRLPRKLTRFKAARWLLPNRYTAIKTRA